MQPTVLRVTDRSPVGTPVGTVTAIDPDAGDRTTLAITAGNAAGTFAIDAATGRVTVADSAAIDLATTASFQLTITATDQSGLTDSAAITIEVTPPLPPVFAALRGWPWPTPGTPPDAAGDSSPPLSERAAFRAAEIPPPTRGPGAPHPGRRASQKTRWQIGPPSRDRPSPRRPRLVRGWPSLPVSSRSSRRGPTRTWVATVPRGHSQTASGSHAKRTEEAADTGSAHDSDQATLWQQFDTLRGQLAEQARLHLGAS